MAFPRLRRYNLTLVRAESSADGGTPYAGLVLPRRQGATVRLAETINPGETKQVTVFNVGRVLVGDQLRNGLLQQVATVVSIPDDETLELSVLSTSPAVVLVQDDRLVVESPIAAFKENSGTIPSAPITSSDTGLLPPTYLKEEFFDAQVVDTNTDPQKTNEPTRLYVDQRSGYTSDELDIRDFGGDIQAALDRAFVDVQGSPAGAVVYIPPGTWTVNQTLVVRGGRITIRGAGLDSRIKAAADFDLVRLHGAEGKEQVFDFVMRDLMLLGINDGGTATGSGSGIVCDGPSRSTGAAFPTGFHFDHVSIFKMPGHGVRLFNVDFPVFLDTSFVTNGQHGLYCFGTAQISCYHCYANNNQWNGVFVEAGQLYWQGIGIENNAQADPNPADPEAYERFGAQLRLKGCNSTMICRTQIEKYAARDGAPTPPAKNGIVLEGCQSTVVEACSFLPAELDGANDPEAIAVRAIGTPALGPCEGVQVNANNIFGIGTGVFFEGFNGEPLGCRKSLLAQNVGNNLATLYNIDDGEENVVSPADDCPDIAADAVAVGQMRLNPLNPPGQRLLVRTVTSGPDWTPIA